VSYVSELTKVKYIVEKDIGVSSGAPTISASGLHITLNMMINQNTNDKDINTA